MVIIYAFILCVTSLIFRKQEFLVFGQETNVVNDIGNPKLCNKTWFMENYFKRNKYIDLEIMERTCKETNVCNEPLSDTPSASARENRVDGTSSLFFSFKNVRTNTSCWGYAIMLSDKDRKTSKYFYAEDIKEGVPLTYSLKTTYSIKIMSLPKGMLYRMSWTSPGRCELEVAHDVYRKMEKQNMVELCKNNLTYQHQLNFGLKECNNNEDPDVRREKLKNYMVINKHCKIIVNEEKISYSKKIAVALSITAVVIVSIILITLIFMYFLRKKHRKNFLTHKTSTNSGNVDQTGPPSVMIIHRPGCEILDSLTNELQSMLMSYGVNMKGSLIDQDILQTEGVASYLQRNIKECDHVLILLTKKDKETSTRHRPYEFALKLLEGLAVHETKTLSYIPLYLQSYYEAVHLFPTFLQASTSYGYRLPIETLRLITKVTEHWKATLESSEEQEMKNHVFLKNIKIMTKDYLKQHHINCCKSHCSKGMHYPSTSNLSSMWASTVDKKWPSFDSINEKEERQNVLLTAVSEQGDCESNCYEKTVKYLQDVNLIERSDDDYECDHDVFLYDSVETSRSRTYCYQPSERIELLPSTCSSSNATASTDCYKYSSESSDGILCESQRLCDDEKDHGNNEGFS